MRISARITLLFPLLLMFGCGRSDNAQSRNDTSAIDPGPPHESIESANEEQTIQPLGNNTFDSFRFAGGPSLVEFGGKNCRPCRNMREILEEFAALRPDIRLGIVFWEDSPELFAQWEISAIPAQVVFDQHGRERSRHRGIWSIEDLLTIFSESAPETP